MNVCHDLTVWLKQISLFSGLDLPELQLLQQEMHLIVFPLGETICREGESGDRMFVIESGKVAVLKQSDDVQPVEVDVLTAGDIAGELSLFGAAPRSATLLARSETRVWILQHAAFAKLLETHSGLANALLTRLSRHLRKETSTVARLLSRGLDTRFKVAFFDSKSYMESAFREHNRYNYALHFLESRLSRETVSLAAGFKAICVFVNDTLDAAVIEELAALGVEMVALRCAGFNNVDLVACERFGLSVARVPAYSPYAVAEHATALMMTLNRRLHRAHNRVREGNFSLAGLVGFDMHGKTAGIVGTGKIGRCLLNILAGFGCRLLACNQFPDTPMLDQLGGHYVPLDELLTASDIISLHAPLTPETHHLINAAAIAKMKRGVMLINTSRGALIDSRALLNGLKSGQIGSAGLDVYEEESDYFFEDMSDEVITDDVLARLLTFNNVIVTSHQAFLTREALASIAEITFENLREFETGRRGRDLTRQVSAVS